MFFSSSRRFSSLSSLNADDNAASLPPPTPPLLLSRLRIPRNRNAVAGQRTKTARGWRVSLFFRLPPLFPSFSSDLLTITGASVCLFSRPSPLRMCSVPPRFLPVATASAFATRNRPATCPRLPFLSSLSPFSLSSSRSQTQRAGSDAARCAAAAAAGDRLRCGWCVVCNGEISCLPPFALLLLRALAL